MSETASSSMKLDISGMLHEQSAMSGTVLHHASTYSAIESVHPTSQQETQPSAQSPYRSTEPGTALHHDDHSPAVVHASLDMAALITASAPPAAPSAATVTAPSLPPDATPLAGSTAPSAASFASPQAAWLSTGSPAPVAARRAQRAEGRQQQQQQQSAMLAPGIKCALAPAEVLRSIGWGGHGAAMPVSPAGTALTSRGVARKRRRSNPEERVQRAIQALRPTTPPRQRYAKRRAELPQHLQKGIPTAAASWYAYEHVPGSGYAGEHGEAALSMAGTTSSPVRAAPQAGARAGSSRPSLPSPHAAAHGQAADLAAAWQAPELAAVDVDGDDSELITAIVDFDDDDEEAGQDNGQAVTPAADRPGAAGSPTPTLGRDSRAGAQSRRHTSHSTASWRVHSPARPSTSRGTSPSAHAAQLAAQSWPDMGDMVVGRGQSHRSANLASAAVAGSCELSRSLSGSCSVSTTTSLDDLDMPGRALPYTTPAAVPSAGEPDTRWSVPVNASKRSEKNRRSASAILQSVEAAERRSLAGATSKRASDASEFQARAANAATRSHLSEAPGSAASPTQAAPVAVPRSRSPVPEARASRSSDDAPGTAQQPDPEVPPAAVRCGCFPWRRKQAPKP